MKILHITPFFPSLEAKHAGGVFMGKESEELSKNNEVFTLSYIQDSYEQQLYEKKKHENVEVCKINIVKKLYNVATHFWLPHFFGVRASGEFWKKICSLIEEHHIEAVHAEYTSMGQYVKKIKKKYPNIQTTIVLHDVVQQSFERQEKKAFGIKRLYITIQKYCISKYEKKYIFACDNVLVLSLKDKNLLKKYYDYGNAKIVNVYCNLEHELSVGKQRLESCKDYKNSICFLGQMSRKENSDAALRLINIFNKIRGKNLQLYIIGNNPPDELKKKASERIHVTGYVEDVDEYMKKATVAVFPLEVGAGIKIKVLHAMALAIPVITTPVGAEGIDESGEALKICHTDEEFISAITMLIDRKFEYYETSRNVHEWVKNNFTWEKTIEVFNDIYRGSCKCK